MKTINLSQGMVAKVDDSDYDWLNKYKWCYVKKSETLGYAQGYVNGRGVRLHRLIMGCKNNDGKLIDHKDRDGLNCQRDNLRFCTHRQNQRNQSPRKGSSSKYLGVHWGKQSKRWISTINISGKMMNLGSFKIEEDAAIAYDKAAIKRDKNFVNLNFTSNFELYLNPPASSNDIPCIDEDVPDINPCFYVHESQYIGSLL